MRELEQEYFYEKVELGTYIIAFIIIKNYIASLALHPQQVCSTTNNHPQYPQVTTHHLHFLYP